MVNGWMHLRLLNKLVGLRIKTVRSGSIVVVRRAAICFLHRGGKMAYYKVDWSRVGFWRKFSAIYIFCLLIPVLIVVYAWCAMEEGNVHE